MDVKANFIKTLIGAKNKKIILRNLFRVLAGVTLLVGVVLGIVFGFDEVTRYNGFFNNPTTETVFELWRAFIFWFCGSCSALCLFAVSTVFDLLIKKK